MRCEQRAGRRRGVPAFALAAALALATAPWGGRPLRAAPVEPPPDAEEGEDYESDASDSVAAGVVETSLGASGSSSGRTQGRRRVRFQDAALTGDVRDGTDDPLAGGAVEARGGSGRWKVGTLGAAWARGLVLGGGGEPWRVGTSGGSPPARRTGQGVRWSTGPGLEVFGARYREDALAGVRAQRSGVGLGLLADRAGRAHASLGIARDGLASELALDRAGRWRAEAELARGADPAAPGARSGGTGRVRLTLRVRGGDEGFRPLVEPRRAGPARALAVGITTGRATAGGGSTRSRVAPDSTGNRFAPDSTGARRRRATLETRASGALWRFRPGVAGARAALEFTLRMAQHDRVSAGFEERHGARREDARPEPFRQGAWLEWRIEGERSALTLGHERWGARSLARGTVRAVSSATLALRGPLGTRWRISHSVHRTRGGERLYVAEPETDRVVLRTLSGDGERSRLELEAPFAGGVARAAAGLGASAGRAPRGQWSLTWTRRAAFRRAR